MTAFQCVMKSMEVVPFFGQDFVTYFPIMSIVVVVFSIVFIFVDPKDLYSKILGIFKKGQQVNKTDKNAMIQEAEALLADVYVGGDYKQMELKNETFDTIEDNEYPPQEINFSQVNGIENEKQFSDTYNTGEYDFRDFEI
ncbi:hypothetical protein QTN25_008804 [Entamoeba marina]